MQSQALAERGLDVSLLAGWAGRKPPADEEHSHTRLRRAISIPGFRLRTLYSPGVLAGVVAESAEVDITHVHLCRDFITMPVFRRALREGRRVVIQTHGMLAPASNIQQRLFDRLFLPNMTAPNAIFLALTDEEEVNLGRLGVEPSQIRMIANAVPTALPANRWQPHQSPTFLFCSRLHVRKQPLVFVDAAIQLLRQGLDARFVIAGPDEGQGAQAARAIEQSGHADSFTVLGGVEHEAVSQLLSECSALVLPSLSEPFPMVALEAASAGTPLILTQESGISQALADRSAALIVAPAVNEVSQAMRLLADNKLLQLELSSNIRSAHDELWTTRALAVSLESIYRDHAPRNAE